MKKTKKFLSVFAILFALVFALSVCFFAACGSDDDDGTHTTHDWDEGTVTTEPTCTAEGEKTYTCSGCDETKTETIDALGHDWVAGTPVNATCTEPGYTPYSCSRCNETKTDDAVDALGHSYGDPTFDGTKWVTACERGDSSLELTSGEGFTFEVETEAELTAAVALDGATIVLEGDITASIVVEGTLSLDLAGFTLTNLSDVAEIDAAVSTHTITVAEDGFLTITDSGYTEDGETVYGTVDSAADGCAAIYVEAGGEAVLNGGTYTRSLEDDDENTYYTVVNHGTMTINAGVAVETDAETECTTVLNGWEESMKDLVDDPEDDPLDDTEGNAEVDTATMTISGGTFESAGDVLVENGVNGELVITGGTFTGNGDDAVILNLNELEISGGTFTQESRYNEDEECSYAGNFILWNYQGDSEDSYPVAKINGGTFNGAWDSTVWNDEQGTLTISDGTFDVAFDDSIVVGSDGSLVITGGTFTSSECEEEDEPEIWVVWVSEGAAEIYGGTFTAGNASDVVVEADEETSTVIYGGTFDGVEDSSIFEFDDGAELTIYGGTFGSVDGPTVFDFDDEAEVAIYGGTFYEDPSDYIDESCEAEELEDGSWVVYVKGLYSFDKLYGEGGALSTGTTYFTETGLYTEDEATDEIKSSCVLSYTTNSSNDKIGTDKATFNGVQYTNSIRPNGKSSSGDARYFTINLAQYGGEKVTIEVYATSKSAGNTIQIVQAENGYVYEESNGATIISQQTAAEQDSNYSVPYTLTATIDEVSSDAPIYYVNFSNTWSVYAISIVVG